MIPLRLNKRRDGSLCLVDAHGSGSSPTREFPAEHAFTYDWLANNGTVVEMAGDTLTLKLANARATYQITGRRGDALDVELADSELHDAPPIDEAKAAKIADNAGGPDVQTVDSGSVANAGSVLVNEGDGS